MNKVTLAQQRGLSLSGLLVGAVILVFIALLGFKLIPAYLEDARIKNTFVAIAGDPELNKASVRDIKLAFSKRADIDDIRVLKPDDIEIAKDGETLVLSASYTIMIPLTGNVSLSLDFNPSSAE